jgi:hypothetical protein
MQGKLHAQIKERGKDINDLKLHKAVEMLLLRVSLKDRRIASLVGIFIPER